jgi:hypothetical protein
VCEVVCRDGAVQVRVGRVVNLSNVDALRAVLARARAQGPSRVLLDCAGVEDFDPVALRLLVSATRRLGYGTLTLLGAEPPLRPGLAGLACEQGRERTPQSRRGGVDRAAQGSGAQLERLTGERVGRPQR